MDLRKVKKLIELAEESGIAELEVTSGDESVRITMNMGPDQRYVTASAVPQTPEPETTTNPPQKQGNSVLAPMAGTFYRAPSPEAPPYVEVGQSVSAGDVLCIIESMKMMHEIRAANSGTVESVLVENGTPIGTGDALFVLS